MDSEKKNFFHIILFFLIFHPNLGWLTSFLKKLILLGGSTLADTVFQERPEIKWNVCTSYQSLLQIVMEKEIPVILWHMMFTRTMFPVMM